MTIRERGRIALLGGAGHLIARGVQHVVHTKPLRDANALLRIPGLASTAEPECERRRGEDRDNRGKVYLYFCPEDTTVALENVQGIGWQGVPDVQQGRRRTPAGRLAAKAVIHAVSLDRDRRTSGPVIEAAVRSAMARAREIGTTSIAFPALGTGVGGFSLQEGARIMVETARCRANAGSAGTSGGR